MATARQRHRGQPTCCCTARNRIHHDARRPTAMRRIERVVHVRISALPGSTVEPNQSRSATPNRAASVLLCAFSRQKIRPITAARPCQNNIRPVVSSGGLTIGRAGRRAGKWNKENNQRTSRIVSYRRHVRAFDREWQPLKIMGNFGGGRCERVPFSTCGTDQYTDFIL